MRETDTSRPTNQNQAAKPRQSWPPIIVQKKTVMKGEIGWVKSPCRLTGLSAEPTATSAQTALPAPSAKL